MKDIKNKIIKKKNAFREKNNEEPNQIYFTSKEENEISSLPAQKKENSGRGIGNLSGEFWVNGPRNTLSKSQNAKKRLGIGNMKIHWDADEFRVEKN